MCFPLQSRASSQVGTKLPCHVPYYCQMFEYTVLSGTVLSGTVLDFIVCLGTVLDFIVPSS